MNAFSTTERNSQLGAPSGFASRALFASAHTDFPGDTGANEVTGGTPPYTRQAVTWGAAAAAQVSAATQPTFNIPAGTTVKWVGFWTLITGGVFLGSVPIGSVNPVPFVVRDAIVDNTMQADNHGFVNGQQVVLFDTDVAVLPGGVTEGTSYYVINAATDAFQIALTSGGAAIDLTTDGAGFVGLITPETFASQGTYSTTSITISYSR